MLFHFNDFMLSGSSCCHLSLYIPPPSHTHSLTFAFTHTHTHIEPLDPSTVESSKFHRPVLDAVPLSVTHTLKCTHTHTHTHPSMYKSLYISSTLHVATAAEFS